jgi:hypothetical protein
VILDVPVLDISHGLKNVEKRQQQELGKISHGYTDNLRMKFKDHKDTEELQKHEGRLPTMNA